MEEGEYKIHAYEILEKEVKKAGNTGRVYLPRSWIGKKVKVVLVEPADKE